MSDLPWQRPELRHWDIVGMNHYHVRPHRMLFVAMTRGGDCIRAEGEDGAVWDDLCTQARNIDEVGP